MNLFKVFSASLVFFLTVSQPGLCGVVASLETESMQQERYRANAMITAIRQGHYNKLLQMVVAGADVNAVGRDGRMPLMQAVQSSDLNAVRLLLEYGADPNKSSDLRQHLPPLCPALGNADLNISQLLIDYGADINASINAQEFGSILVYFCASDANHGAKSDKLFDILLQSGMNLIGRKLKDGVTLMHWFARSGSLSYLKKWGGVGLGFLDVTTDGENALHLATRSNVKDQEMLDVVCFLVEKGVDLNAVDHQGNTPLMHAAKRGRVKTVKYLVKKGADVNGHLQGEISVLDEVLMSHGKSHEEIINFLISSGATLGKSPHRMTLIHAIKSNNIQLIRMVLKVPPGLDHDMITYVAIRNFNRDVVELLLKEGFKLGGKNSLLAFVMSAGKRNDKDNRWLLTKIMEQKGSDINTLYRNGRTVLHLALQAGDERTADLLMEFGADSAIPDPGSAKRLRRK